MFIIYSTDGETSDHNTMISITILSLLIKSFIVPMGSWLFNEIK